MAQGQATFQYDAALREQSYTMTHLIAAWEYHVGIRPVKGDAEARDRTELGALNATITHVKNTLQTLVTRRMQLEDSLMVLERPRVMAAGIADASDDQADGSKL